MAHFFKMVAHFFSKLWLSIQHKLFERHDQILEKKIKREIVVSLTHELKTPLTSILGYAELLEENLKEGENRQYAQTIHKKSQELIRFIDNMIMISVLDFNPQIYIQKETNVSLLLQKTIEEFKRFCQNGTRYEIDVHIEPNIVCLCNERLLSKSFFELLYNSYTYSKKNELNRIELTLQRTGAEILFRIEDNGIGMNEKYIHRVWEKYFRIGDTDTAENSGLGIGLYLVKRVAELSGAEIRLNSKIDVGTICEIRFPTNGGGKTEV